MVNKQQKQIANFFGAISKQVLHLVQINFSTSHTIKDKGSAQNYATEIDLKVEELIINYIKKSFPRDNIIAEENYADQKTNNKERFWIIDPICGTWNLARGIKFFSTNIALAENGKLVAACVIDHNKNQYIWSVGQHKIHLNSKSYVASKNLLGNIIDIDLGSLYRADKKLKNTYSNFFSKVVHSQYGLISLNSSLSYAYVSLGLIAAYVNFSGFVWDVAAAIFLIEQAGGIVTELSGKPWTLESTNSVVALDKKVHESLLSFIN